MMQTLGGCRTVLGSGTEQKTLAEASQQTGTVWASPLAWTFSHGERLSLRCPPDILWHLAQGLMSHQRHRPSLPKDQLRLLRRVRDTTLQAFNQPLHGDAFVDLSLVAEACRRSLLAEHNTVVRAPLFLHASCAAQLPD